MLQANYKKQDVQSKQKLSRLLQDGLFVIALGIAAFLFLALLSYNANDQCWSNTGKGFDISNVGGYVGAWLADVFLCAFGYVAYILPFMLVYAALMSILRRKNEHEFSQVLYMIRSFGFFVVLLSSSSLASIYLSGGSLPFGSGGVLGNLFCNGMINIFNFVGANLILFALLFTGITLFSGLSWLWLSGIVGKGALILAGVLGGQFLHTVSVPNDKKAKLEPKFSSTEHRTLNQPAQAFDKKPVILNTSQIKKSTREERECQIISVHNKHEGGLPPLSLLDQPEKKTNIEYTASELEEMSKSVELRLRDFGIEAHVVAVHPGPVITRFELQLAAGTKVSRVTGIAKDLARSLSVISVRVVEVIPGKSVIGLELPNANREVVRLREILSSEQYEHAHSPLVVALGKDIAGHPVIVDLAKMPHLLVAGTTGSGKSVCLNALLLSLLYKYTPENVRMILIDPKMLELSVYSDIPHLLAPVVTDMKEAANALRWCVAEMERRYKLMVTLGVRNIANYNYRIRDAKTKGAPLLDPLWQQDGNNEAPEELQELPYIVVLADEYADMIMVVGKKVEELISRIAQKARAAGIHLILATQRPSVDVVTGLIKANIPTRIAFQVSSRIDSRTILDQAGAEQLLGFGDMLYLPPGSGIPTRIHGSFVMDEEVHRVVTDLKRRGRTEYLEEITDGSVGPIAGIDAENSGEFTDAEKDPLYDQAVRIVVESQRASISNVQRRLKIGYNRAARLVEGMEAAGIVGPMENNGNREVLVPPPTESD